MRHGRLPSIRGHGGGVIEIVAMNDLTIGPGAVFTANGDPGDDAFRAGGGGSGGTIYLAAGGSIRLDGKLRANGGDGGLAVGVTGGDSLSVPGGGGSGGRIILDAMSVYEGPLSSTTAFGGRGNKGKPYENQNTMYKTVINTQNLDGAEEQFTQQLSPNFPITSM